MFGYLSVHHRFLTFQMHRCYINYYCGLCFGLEHNYGQLRRFLLSNDASFLGILLECHPEAQQPRQLCFGNCRQKRCRFYGGPWDQLASMNLLLIREKLKDDKNDERSLRARAGMVLLGRDFQKAEKKYPVMADAIVRGYADMYALEQAGSGIRPIEERFGQMMVETMSSFGPVNAWQESYIRHISRWIYYIDAIDDYEEDFRKRRFNALHEADSETYQAYVKNHLKTILDDIGYIYRDLEYLAEQIPKDKPEYALLRAMILHDIPLRTAYVLSRRKAHKGKTGSIWEGADRYA